MSSMLNKNYDYESKSNQEKRLIEQKKNLLVLTFHYLISQGYIESASKLQDECGFKEYLDRFDVADNMNLTIVLQGYETYYNETRFQAPKFIRKKEEDIGTKLLPTLNTCDRQAKFLQNQQNQKNLKRQTPSKITSTKHMNKNINYANVDELEDKQDKSEKTDKEPNSAKPRGNDKKENNPKIEVVGQMMYVNKNYKDKNLNNNNEEKERNNGFDEQKEK